MPQPRYSNNRATGVAFALNPCFHPDGPTDGRTVRGTRLVVIASGSFGTPGILERSGIGAKHVLDSVGVKQRVDLPGVGENYQGPMRDSCLVTKHVAYGWTRADHNIIFVPCFAADEAQTFDAIFRNDEGAVEGGSSSRYLVETHMDTDLHIIAATAEFSKTGKGLIANGCAGTCPSVAFSLTITVSALSMRVSSGALGHPN